VSFLKNDAKFFNWKIYQSKWLAKYWITFQKHKQRELIFSKKEWIKNFQAWNTAMKVHWHSW